jgi:L-ascorbate metabolism protein UlaG (beta-lactamase superfamily)
MRNTPLRLTYIGGPTLLIEIGGVRLLTDPTFDPAPHDYSTPVYTLRKTQSPAIAADAIGRIDAVLLSHDHHFDNLDNAGREFLPRAGRVLTTIDGAKRLGGNAEGLVAWQSTDVVVDGAPPLSITATPARHGPEGGDRGPCIGFVLSPSNDPADAVYVSGDTVWFEGVAEVARRFPVGVAVLFMGAAKVAVAGPSHLTFSAADGIEAARAFPRATIVPVHFEGWTHFTEAKGDIDRAFRDAGLQDRLLWLTAGVATSVG